MVDRPINADVLQLAAQRLDALGQQARRERAELIDAARPDGSAGAAALAELHDAAEALAELIVRPGAGAAPSRT